jgi:hypothetical protein
VEGRPPKGVGRPVREADNGIDIGWQSPTFRKENQHGVRSAFREGVQARRSELAGASTKSRGRPCMDVLCKWEYLRAVRPAEKKPSDGRSSI